jgi:hypothetical protein
MAFLKLSRTVDRGNHWVATRDVAVGTVLFREHNLLVPFPGPSPSPDTVLVHNVKTLEKFYGSCTNAKAALEINDNGRRVPLCNSSDVGQHDSAYRQLAGIVNRNSWYDQLGVKTSFFNHGAPGNVAIATTGEHIVVVTTAPVARGECYTMAYTHPELFPHPDAYDGYLKNSAIPHDPVKRPIETLATPAKHTAAVDAIVGEVCLQPLTKSAEECLSLCERCARGVEQVAAFVNPSPPLAAFVNPSPPPVNHELLHIARRFVMEITNSFQWVKLCVGETGKAQRRRCSIVRAVNHTLTAHSDALFVASTAQFGVALHRLLPRVPADEAALWKSAAEDLFGPSTFEALQDAAKLFCGNCFESDMVLKSCARCGACYCSSECQKAHWKAHRRVCV